MEKEFVSYEQALALKELGFNEPCFDFYDNDKELFYNSDNENKIHIGYQVNAPTFSQVFRWFREKYGYDSQVTYTQNKYLGFVADHKTGYYLAATNDFSIHEEAEDALIDKLIELIKQQAK